MLPSLLRAFLHRKRNQLVVLQELTQGRPPFRVLIHAGAHLAQERHHYEALGYRDILWIEGSRRVHDRLAEIIAAESKTSGSRHRTFCALLADKDGKELDLREFSNHGMSSSIFPPTSEMLSRWPNVSETGHRERARTRTLDSIADEFGLVDKVDTLAVDVQGAELLVLKGAERTLRHARAVIAEVSTRRYYDGGVLFPELRDFLKERGFIAMSTPRRHGDLLFLRDGREA